MMPNFGILQICGRGCFEAGICRHPTRNATTVRSSRHHKLKLQLFGLEDRVICPSENDIPQLKPGRTPRSRFYFCDQRFKLRIIVAHHRCINLPADWAKSKIKSEAPSPDLGLQDAARSALKVACSRPYFADDESRASSTGFKSTP